MTSITPNAGFLRTVLGKVGVPIIAGTTVGCLLSNTFEPMHGILFAVGLAAEFLSWRLS
jgi:hypothetical protein